MAGEIRVYLTPEEAESGTTRMIRPAGGRWVEVSIPPTHHAADLLLTSEHGEFCVRVTVVPPGISGTDPGTEQTGWRTSARISVAVVLGILGVAVTLLAVRGCAGPTIAPSASSRGAAVRVSADLGQSWAGASMPSRDRPNTSTFEVRRANANRDRRCSAVSAVRIGQFS